MQAVMQLLFLIVGGYHITITRGKLFFFVIYFYFFVFANDHSYLYKYKIIENVYTQFCSESLFSFLHAEVIFSKRREYMQNKTNKDVQN